MEERLLKEEGTYLRQDRPNIISHPYLEAQLEIKYVRGPNSQEGPRGHRKCGGAFSFVLP